MNAKETIRVKKTILIAANQNSNEKLRSIVFCSPIKPRCFEKVKLIPIILAESFG